MTAVYYHLKEFVKIYPQEEVLGRGTYGKVYKSGKFAVKIAKMEEIFIELDVYSQLNHPCIVKPEAWSIDTEEEKGYLCLPLGESLEKSYKSGKITIEEIISDTLSAVHYMNTLGLAHCDIKPQNMIYHDRKAKIIDMGLVKRAKLLEDKSYGINGAAYTKVYCDPEYHYDKRNNINSEFFALAKSYYDILGHKWSFQNAYSFPNEIIKHVENKEELQWLFNEAVKFSNERKTVTEILEDAPDELIVRNHHGEKKKIIVPLKNYCSADSSQGITSRQFVIAVGWIIDVAKFLSYSAETLFSCVHLANRTLGIVKTSKTLQCFILSCLYLCSLRSEDYTYIEEYEKLVDTFNKYEIYEMCVHILKKADNIISNDNLWTYASCEEDLPDMFDDMLRCDYDPYQTRELLYTGNSKNISAKDFHYLWKNKTEIQIFSKQREEIERKIPYVRKSSETAISDDTPDMLGIFNERWGALIENLLKNDDFEVDFDDVALLIINRDNLHLLKLGSAIHMYAIIRGKCVDYKSTIDRIIKFDWQKYKTKFLRDNNIHPFKTDANEMSKYDN